MTRDYPIVPESLVFVQSTKLTLYWNPNVER
jgi:hypothetical protein